MTILLYIYLAGFVGYEAKSVMDYCDKEQSIRVASKGEVLVIDTVTNIAWPVKGYYQIKNKIRRNSSSQGEL